MLSIAIHAVLMRLHKVLAADESFTDSRFNGYVGLFPWHGTVCSYSAHGHYCKGVVNLLAPILGLQFPLPDCSFQHERRIAAVVAADQYRAISIACESIYRAPSPCSGIDAGWRIALKAVTENKCFCAYGSPLFHSLTAVLHCICWPALYQQVLRAIYRLNNPVSRNKLWQSPHTIGCPVNNGHYYRR